MLTGKEEQPLLLLRSNRGNQESKELPKYLRSTFTDTYQLSEPAKEKKGKKLLPQYAFGNSLESPTYFRNANTLICRESYDNPFIKGQQKPKSKWDSLRSNTLNNYDFYNISEQKFSNLPSEGFQNVRLVNTVTNQVNIVKTPKVKNQDHTFQQAYRTLQNTSHFGRKHELFTDFIEKNDNQNVYGHLNDRQRPKGHLRDVKNFSLNPQEQKLQHKYTFNFNIASPTQKSPRKQQFPKVIMADEQVEKYFKRDQNFLNAFSNSIIATQIDNKMKRNKQDRYNADPVVQDYQENEIGLIEVFEKHLEFEKQYGN
ncbi:unnamed protein product [Paramecium octaurelia]|uniref:Uncharacterized protein n=1 Tax=Paramecium octaurelia TaxID=43137 RepID=A0A8S1UXD5_PAROT|nr:unnamed protein product [Paramecium octaurelia]